MDKVIMPKKLTAENGAKALLMGEFTVLLPEECDECFGENEDCEACAGAGQVMRRVNVPWTVIKEIYDKAVDHLSQPVNLADAEGQCNHVWVGLHGHPAVLECDKCGKLRR